MSSYACYRYQRKMPCRGCSCCGFLWRNVALFLAFVCLLTVWEKTNRFEAWFGYMQTGANDLLEKGKNIDVMAVLQSGGLWSNSSAPKAGSKSKPNTGRHGGIVSQDESRKKGPVKSTFVSPTKHVKMEKINLERPENVGLAEKEKLKMQEIDEDKEISPVADVEPPEDEGSTTAKPEAEVQQEENNIEIEETTDNEEDDKGSESEDNPGVLLDESEENGPDKPVEIPAKSDELMEIKNIKITAKETKVDVNENSASEITLKADDYVKTEVTEILTPKKQTPVPKRTAKLLLWTQFSNNSLWGHSALGRYPFYHERDSVREPYCKTDSCIMTDDKTQLADADVVIFHCGDVIYSRETLIQNRRPEQIFLVLCHEPPNVSSLKDVDAIGMNASATYRLDSDFPLLYDKIVPKKFDLGKYVPQFPWQGKTKSVVWLVSNCETPSRRDLVVDELAEHIDVDIFGSCGLIKCPGSSQTCIEGFAKKYQFYLAFENSLCDDYVTEKLFHAMGTEIIPVVYGGANYSQHAPAKSYIDAKDFASPKELANFLKKVGSSYTDYYEYFEWKKYLEVNTVGISLFCDLCDSARRDDFHRESRPLDPWWQADACHNEETQLWKDKW